MKFFKEKPHRAVFWTGFFVTVLLTLGAVGALYFYKSNVDPNLLALVGSKKITKADLGNAIYARDFLGTAENPTTQLTEEDKSTLLDELIENEIIKQTAEKKGITVTDDEIRANIAVNLETASAKKDGQAVYDGYTKFQKELTWNQARANVLSEKVRTKELAWNKGQYILVRFDRYTKSKLEFLGIKDMEEAVRAEKEASLKVAAKKVADRVYDDLKAGKKFDDVRDSVAKDAEVGYAVLAPDRPMISGVVDANSYVSREGLSAMPAYNSFNDKVASYKAGEISEPFTIKDNDGKDINYYVVYVSDGNNTGYKWGYQKWLDAQKSELVQKYQYQAFLNQFTQKAKAFSGDACGAGTNEHDGFCIKFWGYYTSKSGSAVYIANKNFTLSTGCYGNGVVINGSNRGKFCDSNKDGDYADTGEDNRVTLNSGSNGIGYFSYKTGSTSYEDYVNDYINCNTASAFNLSISGEVAIAGTVQSAGYWSQYGSSFEETANAWVKDSYGFGTATSNTATLAVCMNNDKSSGGNGLCSSADATNWANGSAGNFSYRWWPHWNAAPLADASVEVTGTAATVTGKLTDPDADTVWNKLHYRLVGSTTWIEQTVNTALVASGTSYPIALGTLANGEYEYEWYGNDCHDTQAAAFRGTFSVGTAQVASCSLTVSPQSGLSPLVVVVKTNPNNYAGNFNYNFKNPSGSLDEDLPGRPDTVYYTFPAADTYTVTANMVGGGSCGNAVNVTVSSPTSGGGNEVAP